MAEDEVRPRVDEALDSIAATVGEHMEDIGVVSLLAEGADLLVSEAALARGMSAMCFMPLPREEYRAGTAARYRKRLDLVEARSVVVEPRRRVGRPECYLLAASTMLGFSAALLALWDGGPPRGVGGTADIVRRARLFGIDVFVVPVECEQSI